MMPNHANFRVDLRLASLLGESYRSTEHALREWHYPRLRTVPELTFVLSMLYGKSLQIHARRCVCHRLCVSILIKHYRTTIYSRKMPTRIEARIAF